MALWIYRKTQGNRKVGKRENEWDQHSHHFRFPKVCSIIWVAQAANLWLRPNLWTRNGSSTQKTTAFPQRPQESKKYLFLEIWREMGREVKVVILHVKILIYHWSDPDYDEGSRENDERLCSWGWFLYRPWCSSVDDRKGDDWMNEREELLPSLIAAHEWIARRDT